MKSLLYYLEWNQEKINKKEMIHNKEIITCVNTIRHVIDHMFKELHNIYFYHDKKDEYETMHHNKVVHRNKKRKNNNSRDKKNNSGNQGNRPDRKNKGKSRDSKSNRNFKK